MEETMNQASDENIKSAKSKLLDYYRSGELLKARYPLWNGTMLGAVALAGQENQKSSDNNVINKIVLYEKTPVFFAYADSYYQLVDAYDSLNQHDKTLVCHQINEIQQEATRYKKEDMEAGFEFILANNNLCDQEHIQVPLSEEICWAEIYAQNFGEEALQKLYEKNKRTVPQHSPVQPISSDRPVYDQIKGLMQNSVRQKVYLKAVYPKWNGMNLAIDKINIGDAVVLNNYNQNQQRIDRLFLQLKDFEKNNFNIAQKECVQKAGQELKQQLEEFMLQFYNDYQIKAKAGELVNFSSFNKYAEIYRQQFGEEAFEKLPVIQSLRKEYQISDEKKKNKQKKTSVQPIKNAEQCSRLSDILAKKGQKIQIVNTDFNTEIQSDNYFFQENKKDFFLKK